MNTTVGILAHVDAGKTTFSEQILYKTGTIRSRGRVDAKTASMDYDDIEKRRGITVFAGEAPFNINGRRFCLIDTPGHTDFSGEMERCISVMDCAVLVISAVEGIQAHTETIWKLLEKYGVPVFIFLNKTDRSGADSEMIRQYAEEKWRICCPMFSGNFKNGEMAETLAENIAEFDEKLMEIYFSSGYNAEVWNETAVNLIKRRKIFPVFCGSALNDEGIDGFIEAFGIFAPEFQPCTAEEFSAAVYKIRREKSSARTVFLKVLSGKLRARDSVCVCSEDGAVYEKVNELRSYSGEKYTAKNEASAGDLCAVTGLEKPKAGDIIGRGALQNSIGFELTPVISVSVESSVNQKKLLEYLYEIEDEEPLYGVYFDKRLKTVNVKIMGEIQLDVLKELAQRRYETELMFGKSRLLYKETVADTVIGRGHFEPLRHYAEVKLKIEPAVRGSGIIFKSECKTDDLSANWQNLIKTHIYEKEHKGVLTGVPVTDIKITLLAGRAHLKHTEGGDFREAVYRALRQGLMKAENVLLEPFYAFEAEVEPPFSGRVIADIQKRCGSVNAPEIYENHAVISGRAPVYTMLEYAKEFMSFTRGRGKLSLRFDGYEPCHNSDEIIKEAAYSAENDTENPCGSIFCSHGAGFFVNWQEADGYMHIK